MKLYQLSLLDDIETDDETESDQTFGIDWDDRQWLAMPEEMTVLEPYATQPGNCRSRKPARLIWLYTLGKSKNEILADLRLSEDKLNEYFNRWIDYGVNGIINMISPLGRCY